MALEINRRKAEEDPDAGKTRMTFIGELPPGYPFRFTPGLADPSWESEGPDTLEAFRPESEDDPN
jgi:hypothetical protein